MKSLYNIYEGVLADIDDTLSKSDNSVNTLSELAEARKLKFELDKKDTSSVKFDCPNLLKCLDAKLMKKLSSKSLGTPTSLMLCFGYDGDRSYYCMSVHIFNEHGDRCLYAGTPWEYSHKTKVADLANEIFDYLLKSEKHFAVINHLFDSNHIKYNKVMHRFEAPTFSAKSLWFTLKQIK